MVKKMGLLQKGKKRQRKKSHADLAEPAEKKTKTHTAEPEFSHVRFKFLLRSPETVVKGLQIFLELGADGDDEDGEGDGEKLMLLESYLKSSPQCSEVLDVLTPKATALEVNLVFRWVRELLEMSPSVTKTFSELQHHLVKTILTKHAHLIINSVRRSNKTSYVKSTLMLLLTIAGLDNKFAKLLHVHLDFTHSNWPSLLSQRDRKDELDVRGCITAILMTLLQAEDEEVTKNLVEQKVLLQEVMVGLKYDRSEYVIHSLRTIHKCIIQNGSIGKNPKMYLFNSPVLKELLILYQWPGPSQWKRQPTEEEKKEYTEEQRQVAKWLHTMLIDLLTNHKLGICFRDKTFGLSNENKNSAISKVLQLMLTSYTAPLSHQLVMAILQACPDQTAAFLKQLQPHLSPRPIDTWITCLHFFLKIVENHEWPTLLMDNVDSASEEKMSQVVHYLFPPEAIISTLKEGLKNSSATVRHLCLRALVVVATHGRHFCSVSRSKLGDQAPVTLGIEGFVSKTLPGAQVLLNLVQKCSSKDSFSVPIARDLYKDTEVTLPHVSRFQHLVAILQMYSLAPEHLTGGAVDTLPQLFTLVAQVAGSEEEIDMPPEDSEASLPSLCLLHALSQCDVRKLTLFGKGGNRADLKHSLVHQLVCLMQAQSEDTHMQTAHSLIVKLLAGTGLFDNHQRELAIWLQHLQDAEEAPQEVVMYFLGLLRQYVSNPYPAIDRLLEQVEASSQLTDGQYLPYARLEFSPLVMFALEGDFVSQSKVHQYICSVLTDILHSLHNPCSFSRLVHISSSNLDPEVTQYLTFHTTDEEATLASIMKRQCRKVRLKQLKSSTHAGVMLMKKLSKGQGEVTALVEKLSASECLSLIHQSLRYLDELVSASVKTEGELLNKKLAEVCVETLKAAFLHLAHTSPQKGRDDAPNAMETDTANNQGTNSNPQDGDIEVNKRKEQQGRIRNRSFSEGESDSSTNDLSSDEETEDSVKNEDSDDGEDINDDRGREIDQSLTETAVSNRYCAALSTDLGREKTSLSRVSQQRTNWLHEATLCLLSHPLVSQWLFVEGFKQGGTPREWVVHQLCDVLQTLPQVPHLELDSIFDAAANFRRLVEAVVGDGSKGGGQVPEDVQLLLCQCLEAMFVVGGSRHGLEGLMALVSLPVDNFRTQSSESPSPLARTLFRIADSVKLDSKSVKELRCHKDLASSFQGLFALVSGLDSEQLESVALRCVQRIPEVALACSSEAFRDLLSRMGDVSSSSDLFLMVESLLANSPLCWSACGQWMKKKMKNMKKRKQEFAPIMFMYLRLLVGRKGIAAEDSGLQAITEAVCHDVGNQALDADHVSDTFLHVICYLVNADMIETPVMQRLQDTVLAMVQKGARLLEGHIQLLATVLRHQSLCISDPGQAAGEQEEQWRDFEENAGKVLLGCLQYLTSTGVKVGKEQVDQEECCTLMVCLCQDLLSLMVKPEIKAAILTFWPTVVTLCLKHHYKDVQYVSLLHQVLQAAFAEDKGLLKDTIAVDTMDEEHVGTTKVEGADSGSDEEDSGVEEDDNGDDDKTAKSTKMETAPPPTSDKTPQNKKSYSMLVTGTAKMLGIVSKADIARKCVALFGKNMDQGQNHFVTDRSDIVRLWTGEGQSQQSFFLWPDQRTSQVSKTVLASPSHSKTLVDLCEKVVGHTAFLSVLQDSEHKAVRGELVSLLACIIRLEKSCCNVLPLNALVAAYRATLSLTDQNLLYLLLACDTHGSQKFSPGLWGEKAVKQLELKKHMGKSLLHETSLQNILDVLDPDTMAASILHFPLMRTMQFQHNECAVKAERMMSHDGCYDPRFLLQLFFHFMGPEHIVDIRSFVASSGLGFTLAALSSHDLLTRQVAISILANLHSHAEMMQRWSGAPILVAFLKVVMHAMTKEGQKLPSVITVFLAKVADFFMKPGSDMYVAIHSYLMLKPALDVNNVPEFYHFFNSPKPKERMWILHLLQDGLRETSDHRLFQRRFVYKLLTCHANSSLSDHQTRRESLKVLIKGCSIATVAKDLVTKHGLLPWLASFIKDTLPDKGEITRLVCQLLHNLCYTPEFNRQRLWWLSVKRLSRQCLHHVPLLVCVRLLLEGFSELEAQSVGMLLDILQHPHLTPSGPATLLPQVVMVTWHLAQLEADMEAMDTATRLSQLLHFKLPSVLKTKPQKRVNSQEEVIQTLKVDLRDMLRKRTLSLLCKCEGQDATSSVMETKAEGELSVPDLLSKLQVFLTQ